MSIFRDVVLPTIFSFVDEWAYSRHQHILISLSDLHRFCKKSKNILMGLPYHIEESFVLKKYILIPEYKCTCDKYCCQQKAYQIRKEFHADDVNYISYTSYVLYDECLAFKKRMFGLV
jgi:hypothetical protein